MDSDTLQQQKKTINDLQKYQVIAEAKNYDIDFHKATN